jgi:hypothetical protein
VYPNQELGDASREARPLRRRVALLLGLWVVKIAAEERPSAYGALVALLGDPDAALRLAAVGAPFLHTCKTPAGYEVIHASAIQLPRGPRWRSKLAEKRKNALPLAARRRMDQYKPDMTL